MEIARQDPPLLVAGDLNERLLDVAAQAPAEAALVVFHSAVMGYLSARAATCSGMAWRSSRPAGAATGFPTRGKW